MTSIYDPEAVYVGMDVHKDTISVGVLEPGSDSPVVDNRTSLKMSRYGFEPVATS